MVTPEMLRAQRNQMEQHLGMVQSEHVSSHEEHVTY